MSDFRPTILLGKEKVFLRLNFEKVLTLFDILYIPDIRVNLVFASLL